MIILLFIIFVGALFVILIQRQRKMKETLELSKTLRNKYMALPILGHGLMFLGSNEDRMKAFQKFGYEAIRSKYGMTSTWLGTEYYTFVCDPIIADIISKACLDKPDMTRFSRPLIGNGSIFAPVNIWRPRRKVVAPTFSVKKLNCYLPIFVQQSIILANCLAPKLGAGTFSIWEYIASYTTDTVCQTILGVNMSAQKLTNHPFLKAFGDYTKLLSARILQIWLHWDPLYKCLPVYLEAEKNLRIIHDFVDEVIQNKKMSLKQQIAAGDNVDETRSSSQTTPNITFLDLLISSSGGANGYTNLELREETLVLLLAGTDTSAVGACFSILMLSRYMDVQEKAYREIKEIFGDSKRPVSLDDLPRLKYIDALIKEALRLYPPVPIISRRINRNIKMPSGITLPAGISAAIFIWGIHRNPRYWGEDAEEFNPDRFLKPLEYPSAYMAFSYGPRNCLGYQYAMMSMKIAIATLLREYRVLPPDDIAPEDWKKPLRLSFNIMMKDVDNFKVRIERRK